MIRSVVGAGSGLADLLEEFAARLEAGEASDVEAFAAAHPEHAEQLRRVLPTMLVLADLGRSASAGGAAPPSAGADSEPTPGVLGDFRIVREVGRGGMGIVYEAEQITLRRRVALKVLPFAATMDPRHLQRFHNEARAAAGLHHTNIVPVHGVGSERGVHFYAMQFIEGQTLAVLIAEQRQRIGQAPLPADQPTTPHVPGAPAADTAERAAASTERPRLDAAFCRRAAEWGIQAAEALDHAHQMGIVHRDVKPANLLVDVTGRLWVTDFGLAQVQSDVRVTMTGDLVGTLRYMSPEQALAKRVVVDHCTDVYSLGATLYELLTLRPAFEGNDRQELLRQIAFEEPTRPRRLDRSIPGELETIVVKALEKNPRDRYPTAQELADDLRRFLEDRPIRARRPSVFQRLRKLARRHRAVVTAAAVCLLVTLVALGGSVGWAFNDRAARQREADAQLRDAESRLEEAIATAEPLLREGNPANLALVSAAQRVEALLGSGAVGPEVQRRAEQFLRDVHMLADLDDARLRRAETKNGAMFDVSGADSLYAAAFQRYGIEVLALDPAEAAARMRNSAIHEALVAGLEDWMEIKALPVIQLLLPPALGRLPEYLPEPDPDLARLQRVADAADDNSWRRAFRQAALALDEQKLKALAGQPEALAQPPAVLAWLGSFLQDRGLHSDAAAVLRQAQQRHPADFWINYHLGGALVWCWPQQGHSGEAVGYCRAAIAIRPSSAEAHSLLGAALFDNGDTDAAIVAYQQALALDSRFIWARWNLAAALHRKRDWTGEIACFEKAIELDPKNARAHNMMGLALFHQGKVDQGIACFNKAIEVEPKIGGYNAACFAARCGCGLDEGADRLDDRERARLRQQGLTWLRDHLALRAKQLASSRPKDRAVAQFALKQCLVDTDFRGVHGEALAKLPEAEQQAWRTLWADVAETLTRAPAAAEKKSDKK